MFIQTTLRSASTINVLGIPFSVGGFIGTVGGGAVALSTVFIFFCCFCCCGKCRCCCCAAKPKTFTSPQLPSKHQIRSSETLTQSTKAANKNSQKLELSNAPLSLDSNDIHYDQSHQNPPKLWLDVNEPVPELIIHF